MNTRLIVLSSFCILLLLIHSIPEVDAFKELLDFDIDIDKKFKKKLAKKLLYYFLLTGNKKVYAVPVPLPVPIPILKKLQPIIYKESHPIPHPVEIPIPFPVPMHHYQENHGGCCDGGYGQQGYGQQGYGLQRYGQQGYGY